jgi:type I restriction enzyme S subunit
MVPEGWQARPLSECLEKVIDYRGKAPPKTDTGVRLITARNVRMGYVSMEHAEYIDEQQYTGWMNRGLPTEGDIMFTTEAPLGNIALFPSTGVFALGQRIVTLRVNETCKSGFLFQFLLSEQGQRLIHSKSSGSTALGIKSRELVKVLVPTPPLPDQRKIADILSTWDQAIEKTEALLSNARTQKRALMQQLLTGKRRFPAFEDQPWNTGEFDDLFTVANDKKTQVNKRDYLAEGVTPVVDQGQNFIVGYTNHEQRYSDVPVIIFGDHTRALKWVDFEFCPGADGTQLLKTTPKLDQKLGYYMLQNLELPNLGYSRHMRELKQSTFDYPPTVEEQSLLASVFSEADAEITLLEGDITKIRTEKKALMQQLLTGKRRVKVEDYHAV